LVQRLKTELTQASVLDALGIGLEDNAISAISPTPETTRALEDEALEAILREADEAIYSHRKSAVEQERTIKDGGAAIRAVRPAKKAVNRGITD